MPPNFALLDVSRSTVPGRTRRSRRPKNGGATCLQTLALASESGAPTWPSKKRSIGSPMKSGSSFAFDTLDRSVALVVRMGSATYPFRAFTDIRWSHLLGNISIIDARRPMPTASSGAPKPGELSLQSPRPPRANEVME
jgi:hypothetical protein